MKVIITIIYILLGITIGISFIKTTVSNKIDLPEECRLITSSDTLKGYYDKDSVLHIEFNNKQNK